MPTATPTATPTASSAASSAQHLVRRLTQLVVRRLLAVGGFLLGVLAVSLLGTTVVAQTAPADAPPVLAPGPDPTGDRVVRLVEAHGCWSGEAPAEHAGSLPGHVVVTRADGSLVHSARLVGPALDQTVGGVPGGLVVHAFCP